MVVLAMGAALLAQMMRRDREREPDSVWMFGWEDAQPDQTAFSALAAAKPYSAPVHRVTSVASQTRPTAPVWR
ncbi:MAG: hypothetical protein JWP35_283 [Caulobacter sp.]|nr:hypothetical protein [Caulobacter sp.]